MDVERTRATGRGVVLLALWLLLAPSGIGPAHGRDAESETKRLLKEAAGRMADGDPHAALVILERALEYQPEHPDLLRVACEAAEKADDKDKALWYARLGHTDTVVRGVAQAEQKAWTARIDALDPFPAAERTSLQTYAESLLRLADLCVKRRLYANAVDFYMRCKLTPLAGLAEKGLEKLYKSKRAVEALMRSGLDVPLRQKSAKSAKRVAREDKKHESWSSAWRLKGKNYTIITNMGWEVAETVSAAMEQANQFYRDVFQHKQGGGNTARCTIRLYRTREDFVTHEKEDDPTLMGFFQPGHNYVATFDHRDIGHRYSELWETLFHECLHQFTSMVLNQRTPGWLDEGLATYFEGTRLLANGRVEYNLAHTEWLRSLQSVLEEGKPTFKDVIAYFQEGSFDASYYPISYGLVYFFKNYEDENAERVYEPAFNAYLKTYRSGGKHDPVERFEEYFVKKAKQPGIKTLEAFRQRWRSWIDKLIKLQLGGPEQADALIARSRNQLKHGKHQAGAATLRWALRKRPQDPTALLELAKLHAASGDKDAAIFTYRQLRAVCRRMEDPEAELLGMDGVTATDLGARCAKCVAAIDDYVSRSIGEADQAFATSLTQAADGYVEKGFPRTALWLLDAGRHALGGSVVVTQKLDALQAASGVSAARWRRLVAEEALERWVAIPGWSVEDGVIVGKADASPIDLYYRDEMPESYRLEVDLRARSMKPDGYVGLVFGVDESYVLDVFGVNADGSADLCRVEDDWAILKTYTGPKAGAMEPFQLGLVVDHGTVTLFVDGKQVGRRSYPAAEMRGRIGLFAQDGEVEITKIRVAY